MGFPVLRKNAAKTKDSKQAFTGEAGNVCLGGAGAFHVPAMGVMVAGLHPENATKQETKQSFQKHALAKAGVTFPVLEKNSAKTRESKQAFVG